LTDTAMLFLFLLSVLDGPAEYLTHEGAHYLVARAFSADPTIHFDHVALHETARFGTTQNLLFTAAGPIADWAVGIGALVFLARRYTPLALVLAVWIARPLQFLHGLLGIELSELGLPDALAGTDEAVIGQALGVSARSAIAIELCLAIPLMLAIVYYMPSGRRVPIIGVLTSGVLFGWAGWLAVGPYLLP
jgi:hypothetical protein